MILSEEERDRFGTIDPLLAEAVLQRPGPRYGSDGMEANRRIRAEHLADLRHLTPIPGPIPEDVLEIEHSVVARDAYKIPIKIYKPRKGDSESAPVIVMMHEGGWHFGDMTDEDLNCRMFARDLGAVCVNVDYRLMPEHPFTKCVEDCYDVLRWITSSASQDLLSPADPNLGFIVGGASAGGNLAAVMCQLGRDNNLSPPLTGQYLGCAALIWNDVVPDKWRADYRSFYADADPLLGEYSKAGLENLAGPGSTDPRFSPLLHPDLTGLPACYFQVAGLDPFRDEALIYEKILRGHGTETRLDMYAGHGHMFWTNWPGLQRSKDFVNDTLQGFKWLLSMIQAQKQS